MIETPYENKLFSFYITAVVTIGRGLGLRIVIETNLVRLSYRFTSHCFYLTNSCYQYIINKMEGLSCRCECDVHGHSTCIKAFKRRAGLGYK